MVRATVAAKPPKSRIKVELGKSKRKSRVNFDDDAGDAGRSVARIDGKNGSFSRWEPPDAKPAPPRTTGNTADPNRLKPCRGKQSDLSNDLELETQKGNPSQQTLAAIFD